MQKVKTIIIYLGVLLGVLGFSYGLMTDNENIFLLSLGILVGTILFVGSYEGTAGKIDNDITTNRPL